MAEPVTNSALPAPENLGGISEGSAGVLVQRLEQRLTTSAGVINTQTLHRHEAATTGLAGRLLQRLALPEQRLTRYQIGVAQPGAVTQSLQRFQRREVMPAGGDRSWIQRLSIPGVETMAGLEPLRSPIAASDPFSVSAVAPRSLAEPASVSGAERGAIAPLSSSVSDMAATPVGTFRIQRRAPSLMEEMLQPLASSHFPSNPANAVAEGDAGVNSPSANDLTLAVPHSAAIDTSGNLGQPLPVSDAQPTSVAQLKPIEPPMGDGSGTSLRLLRRYTLAEVIAPSPPRSSTALPLASVVSPTIQRSLGNESREPVAKPYALAAIAQISRPSVVEASIQRQVDDPMSSQNQSSDSDPLPLAQAIRPSLAPASPAFPLLQTSQLTLAPLSQGRSSASQPSLQSGSPASANPLPLPLALGAIAPNSIIQRQVTETTMAESSSAPLAPAPVGAAAPAMDAADMADQVSRILDRQLAVERERRGLGL